MNVVVIVIMNHRMVALLLHLRVPSYLDSIPDEMIFTNILILVSIAFKTNTPKYKIISC